MGNNVVLEKYCSLSSLKYVFWSHHLFCAFHLLLRLCELVKLQSSCKKLDLLSELMDHSGDYVHAALPFILSLLQQGLGQRISLLTHSLSPDPEVGNILIQGLPISGFEN